jgi:hypothetical protein
MLQAELQPASELLLQELLLHLALHQLLVVLSRQLSHLDRFQYLLS